jgi:hypothetical protein
LSKVEASASFTFNTISLQFVKSVSSPLIDKWPRPN